MIDGISRCSVPEIPRGLHQLESPAGDVDIIVVEQTKMLDFSGKIRECRNASVMLHKCF